MTRSLACLGVLLLAAPGWAQFIRNPAVTVAQLPSAGATGRLRAVTDGASATDCSSGLGSHKVLCMDDGDSWEWVGAGGGGAQNLFQTFAAPSGTNPVADSSSDTLTLTVSAPLSINGDAATDTLDFSVTAASTSAPGVCELATSGETTAGLCVQASDSRLIGPDSVVLGTHTSGGYAGSATEAGPATSALTATTALGVAANSVPLGSGTTGDYVSGGTSGGGLTKTGTEGATLGLTPCASDGQVPKYTAAGGWACANDSGGAGDVAGPSSATSGALAAFDGTTGKLLKNTSLFSTAAGGFQVGSGGPVIKHLGAGYVSLFMADETTWTRVNAEVYRSLDGAGTIKATIGTNGVELASAGCIVASSTPVAGGGDTTLCRASAGAWGVDGIRYVPRANPIVTCGNAGTAGYLYYDDSGALCGCDGTSWNKIFGGGTCS